MKTAVVLIADGSEEIETVTPADLLVRAGIKMILASVSESRKVKCSRGIIIEAEYLVADLTLVPDCIVIPGGMPGSANIANNNNAIDLINSVYDAGGVVAAICAAPAVVLAKKTKILDGKKATCFPGAQKDFHSGIIYENKPVVKAGQVITADGPGSAYAFGLEIISSLEGLAKAQEVALKS